MLPEEMIERLRQEPPDVQNREVTKYLNNEHPQGKLLHILTHKELTARLGITSFLGTIENGIHQTQVGVDAAFWHGRVQEYRTEPGMIAQYKRDDVLSELPGFLNSVKPYFRTASRIGYIPKEFIPDLTRMETCDLDSLRNRISEIEVKLSEVSILTPHLIDLYYQEAMDELI